MLDNKENQISFEEERSGRRRPSFFGPIVLIGIGVLFLLVNLGLIPELSWNWLALLQLWPLWLIFLGINLIVRQLPGAAGGILSALVGVAALAVFGYILLAAEDNAILNRFQWAKSVEIQRQSVSYPAENVDRASIDIVASAAAVEISALEDSGDLLNGNVSYVGELIFDRSIRGGQAIIHLDTEPAGSGPFNFIGLVPWTEFGRDENQWQIGLNSQLPLDLMLDAGSGRLELNLGELQLDQLEIDAGSGSVDLTLPGGSFNTNVDVGSGSFRVTCGSTGRQTIRVDAGSGSLAFHLPSDLEARVEIDSGSGSVNLDLDRFHQISGDEDEGIWETANYSDAPNRVELLIEQGSGSLTIGR